jgi:hypothetical protein
LEELSQGIKEFETPAASESASQEDEEKSSQTDE